MISERMCDRGGCSKPATYFVSDGPAGLSPRTNQYYLCEEHCTGIVATNFEHCVRLQQ